MTLMAANGIPSHDKRALPVTAALLTDHKLISLGLPAFSGTAMVVLTDVYYGRSGMVQLFASHNEWDVLFLGIGYQKMSDMRMVTKVFSQKTTTSVVIVAPAYNKDEERIYKSDGAKAYILECEGVNNNCDSIIPILHEISQRRIMDSENEKVLSGAIAGSMNSELFNQLSPREREVINLYLEGMSVTQIANVNQRSIKTVSAQKVSAMKKLGLDNSMEIFRALGK